MQNVFLFWGKKMILLYSAIPKQIWRVLNDNGAFNMTLIFIQNSLRNQGIVMIKGSNKFQQWIQSKYDAQYLV